MSTPCEKCGFAGGGELKVDLKRARRMGAVVDKPLPESCLPGQVIEYKPANGVPTLNRNAVLQNSHVADIRNLEGIAQPFTLICIATPNEDVVRYSIGIGSFILTSKIFSVPAKSWEIPKTIGDWIIKERDIILQKLRCP